MKFGKNVHDGLLVAVGLYILQASSEPSPTHQLLKNQDVLLEVASMPWTKRKLGPLPV